MIGILKCSKYSLSFIRRSSNITINKMRLVALISGGKDSCYNMLQCVAAGHEIAALAHLKPSINKEELDSFMYQTIGHNAMHLYAEAMGLPLYQAEILGTNVCQDMIYRITAGDEVEDLFKLLKRVKEDLKVDGVAVGAIMSNYQRLRVENVCHRLGLTAYSYLWRRNQEDLLSEMIASRMKAIVVKVAALGLEPNKHLGKEICELFPHLIKMNELYGLNVCGEGGEYETFTLDCPLFNKRIVIDEQEAVIHSDDAFAPVGYLLLKKFHLEPKQGKELSQPDRIKDVGVCSPIHFLLDLDFAQENMKLDLPEKFSNEAQNSVAVDFVSCNVLKSESGWFWISGLNIPDEGLPGSCLNAALVRLKELLNTHGLRLEEIISVQLLVKNMNDFVVFNSAYKPFFSLNPPSRVCVEVPLPRNIGAIINCVGFQNLNPDLSVNHMHVQTVSHWAPANIGPYSQAVQVAKVTFVSGQIGLVPGTMQLIDGGIAAESALSLRHVKRILQGINSDLDLLNVFFGICYVTQECLIPTVMQQWIKSSKVKVASEIMNFVVVPVLPKNAMVEWQVVAYEQFPTGWTLENLVHVTVECVLLEIKILVNKLTTKEKSEAIIYGKCSSSASEIDEKTLTSVLRHFEEIVRKCPTTTTVNFQVYCPRSMINFADMYNCVKKISNSRSTFSCIPVTKIASPSCLLIFGYNI